MKKVINLVAGAAIAAAVAGSASAGIIYQSTPTIGPGNGMCSECGASGGRALDPFTLGTSATITGVDVAVFTGSPAFNGLNPFTVDVYSENDPSTLIFSQPVTPTLVRLGFDGWGNNAYDVVHADLSGVSLQGGHQYWISFFAPMLAIETGTGGNGGAIGWDAQGNTVPTYAAWNLEYALYAGAVPEPATWAMLVMGLGAIGFAARRRNAGTAAAI